MATIKYLYDDADANYKRNGLENRYFVFEVDNCEVVPLCDAPHLLKGARNVFSYDVKYKWRKLEYQVATWSHIRKFYEKENDDFDYKVYP